MEQKQPAEEQKLPPQSKINPLHGQFYDPSWSDPVLAISCKDIARPGYQDIDKSEYNEKAETLKSKISLLASLIRKSNNFVVYTGAGISVAAGLGDYASKGGKSISGKQKIESVNRLQALPTFSHYALTALYQKKYLKHWVQQNHDGLAQKSGYPQKSINEIHGSWFDKKNPVVFMDGELRKKKTDLVLAVGTSLCGMNADRIASTVADKAQKGEEGKIGLVIINLQKTQIFGVLDKVMAELVREMKIQINKNEVFSNPMKW